MEAGADEEDAAAAPARESVPSSGPASVGAVAAERKSGSKSRSRSPRNESRVGNQRNDGGGVEVEKGDAAAKVFSGEMVEKRIAGDDSKEATPRDSFCGTGGAVKGPVLVAPRVLAPASATAGTFVPPGIDSA